MRASDAALAGARDDGIARARVARVPLIAAAWTLLLLFDVIEKTLGFQRLYRLLSRAPRRRGQARPATTERLCDAVNAASVCYVRRVRCLQSAAAAVCLLRFHRIPADLVIGIRRLPFSAHAWVEVDRQVVMNEQPDMGAIYRVIARC